MSRQITVYEVEGHDHHFDTAISLDGTRVKIARSTGVKIGDIVEISDAGATSVVAAEEIETTDEVADTTEATEGVAESPEVEEVSENKVVKKPKTSKARILGASKKPKK